MTRVAITGHRGLPAATERLVDAALRAEIAGSPGDLVGLSCLADGADTLFAKAVLDGGGSLVAIVPAARYRDGLPAAHHPAYDALLARAVEVIRLDHVESTGDAHLAASLVMLGRADRLLAIWDGLPARGHGGTADVVRAARDAGLPVTIVWPHGAARELGPSAWGVGSAAIRWHRGRVSAELGKPPLPDVHLGAFARPGDDVRVGA